MDKSLPGQGPHRLEDWLKTSIPTQGLNLFQLFVCGILLMVMALLLASYPANLPAPRFWGSIFALVALLLLNIFWLNPDPAASPRRRAAHDWVFLCLSSLLVMAAVALSGQVSVAYLQSIVCAQADFKRGVWPAGAAFGAANLAAWFGLQTAMGLPLSQVVGVESSLVVGFAFGLLVVALIERYARQTSRAEALLKELQIANFELETARQMERDLAVAAERVRLARDIHDGLGHHLTVLSIQLQAAAKLVERSPQDAAEAIRACREEAQAALDEVRSSVGLMRQPLAGSETLAEALASLVQNFDRRAGLRARFTCEGAPVELSPFARETLFRAVQEGLTNARKHARGASCVFVDLAYAPVSIRLRLRDDGEKPAGAPASGSPGFGLAGLRERVGRLGGDFRSGPGAAGGFELEICIPIEGKKDDPRAAG